MRINLECVSPIFILIPVLIFLCIPGSNLGYEVLFRDSFLNLYLIFYEPAIETFEKHEVFCRMSFIGFF